MLACLLFLPPARPSALGAGDKYEARGLERDGGRGSGERLENGAFCSSRSPILVSPACLLVFVLAACVSSRFRLVVRRLVPSSRCVSRCLLVVLRGRAFFVPSFACCPRVRLRSIVPGVSSLFSSLACRGAGRLC